MLGIIRLHRLGNMTGHRLTCFYKSLDQGDDPGEGYQTCTSCNAAGCNSCNAAGCNMPLYVVDIQKWRTCMPHHANVALVHVFALEGVGIGAGLYAAQHHLLHFLSRKLQKFTYGGDLAAVGFKVHSQVQVASLESQIHHCNAALTWHDRMPARVDIHPLQVNSAVRCTFEPHMSRRSPKSSGQYISG